MNELKFRAWHKEDKKHYEVVTIHLKEERVTVKTGFGIFGIFDFDEVIIEQYTGKVNSEEIEMCAGDIIRFDYFGSEYGDKEEYLSFKEVIREVYYKDGCFRIRPLHNYAMEYGDCICGLTEWDLMGNIHENGDLIKWPYLKYSLF